MTNKKAEDFLQTENRDLRFIFGKIKRLTELNALVKPLLGDQIKDNCQVANLNGDQLILLAANGSIATQIRFQSNELLRKLKQNPTLQHIRTIQCIVRPENLRTQKVKPQSNGLTPLSQETAEIVREIARTIEDPTLREIIERIAKRT